MKILYIILFFASTLLLIFLTFYLLKMIDNGTGLWSMVLTLSGMILSIALLAFFLYRYFKVSSSGNRY